MADNIPTSPTTDQPLSTPGEIEEASIEPITDSLIPSDVTINTPVALSEYQTTQATTTAEPSSDVIDTIPSDDLFTVKLQNSNAPVAQPDPLPPLDLLETAEQPLDDSLQSSVGKSSAASMTGSTDSYVVVTDPVPSPPQTITESQLEPEPVSKPEEWLDVLGNGSLKKLTVQKGGSQQPTRGERVLLDLTGRLSEMEGLVVEEQRDLEVEVGEADVVQGLDLALPLMTEGEIAWVYMQSRFGYGETGNGDNIPANADLYYMVKLKEVHPRYNYAGLTEDKLRELVERKKSRGNSMYKLCQLALAVTAYSSAIKALQAHQYSDTPEGKLIGCRILTNLAIAQYKQDNAHQSLVSCDKALGLVPGDTKALYRKSIILIEKQEYEESICCLEEALRYSPEDVLVEQELRRVRALNEQSNRRQRELYRRMISVNTREQTQPKEETEGSRSKLVVLVASSVIAVAAICVGLFLFKRT